MAKSARSKWKRARNAEKRVLYTKKGLDRLKAMVQKRDERENLMKQVTEVKIKKEPSDESAPTSSTSEKKTKDLTFNFRTLQNSLGHYPVWMKKEAIRKHKKSLKKKVFERRY